MMKHPNIIKLKEVLASNSKIFLVLELIEGGDLLKKLDSKSLFNLKNIEKAWMRKQLDYTSNKSLKD